MAKQRKPTSGPSGQTTGQNSDDIFRKSTPDIACAGMPVVCLGTSAGGLETLAKFFRHLPAATGMAYVVVTHLSRTHKSHLSELLAGYTDMAVTEIDSGRRVEPDHVYVIPPDNHLSIRANTLVLHEPTENEQVWHPIDFFLRSLARDRKADSVCIILSGTGNDGSLGLQDIKAEGGVVIVQQPESAPYDGMPRNALMTGMVDLSLAVEQIPAALINYVHRRTSIPGALPSVEGSGEVMTRILDLLLLRKGHDLTFYKDTTILRRLGKRMVLAGVDSLESYATLLEQDQSELEALFKDLFIGVTSFFRDPAGFTALNSEVIPQLFTGKNLRQPLRVWVTSCSTGEEAYSIAMLLREYMEQAGIVCEVQVFATDISQEAIDKARTGTYPISVVSDLTPDLIKKYFTVTEDHCTISKSIREMLIFAQHDLLWDPPFFKIDLICCRNMLIYLTAEAQEDVLRIFHHALTPGGCLFLGSSESLGRLSELFICLDAKWKLFRKKEQPAMLPDRLPAQVLRFRHGKRQESFQEPPEHRAARTTILEAHLHRKYGHPAVLVDDRMEVLHFFGDTQQFIGPPEGAPTTNLFRILKGGLKAKLKTAIQEVVRSHAAVTIPDLRLPGFLGKSLNIIVEPLKNVPQATGLMLVVFEVGRDRETTLPLVAKMKAADVSGEDIVAQLELELKATSDQLQSTIEEQELSNEELSSMNEELQASNEELETSREELQALNEELTTVNVELNLKIEELQEAYNDIDNLFVSTNMATIFVDRELLIRRFTPAASNIFHLLKQDIGRPLGHIVSKVEYPDLIADCRKTLEKTMWQEKEVSCHDGLNYIVRLFPYRTREEAVEGVVLTFLDVTELKKVQTELQAHRDRLEEKVAARTRELAERESLLAAILHNYPGGLITILDRSYTVLFADGAGFAELALEPAGVIGRSLADLVSRVEFAAMLPTCERVFAGETAELEIARKGKVYVLTASPLIRQAETIEAIIVVARDVSRQKEAEQELVRERDRARRYLDIAGVIMVALDRDGSVTMLNRKGSELLGMEVSELLGRNWFMRVVPEEEQDRTIHGFQELMAGRLDNLEYFENRIVTSTGEPRLIAWHNTLLKDLAGKIIGTLSSGEDITERRLQEKQIRQLALFPDQNPSPVLRLDAAGRVLYANEAARGVFSLIDSDMAGAALPEVLTENIRQIFSGQTVHGLEVSVDGRTYLFTIILVADYGYVNCYGMDVTERKIAIHALQRELDITAALSRLYNSLISSESTMEDIAVSVSKEAGLLTGSAYGFTGRLDPITREVIGHTFTEQKSPSVCAAQKTGKLVFMPDADGSYPGLWGHSLNTGKPFYTNDPRQHPRFIGVPRGHFRIDNLLNVPIVLGEEVVGQIMVANKEGGYVDDDIHALVRLAEHCALAIRRIRVEGTTKANERLRALGEMASGIVHDINNALSPVIGYTDLLLNRRDLPEEKREDYLGNIRTAAADIAHIIANMREFYRQRDPDELLLPMDVNSVINQVVELTGPKWKDIPQERGVTIRMMADLEEKLPKIRGNEAEFREMITNLLFNSVDSMPEGGTIIIRNRIQGDDMILEVSDTGVGMSDHVRIRCLEPLFTTKKDKGTGMGLAQVYGIVQRHGGDIEINSRPGWGTTVRLRFGLYQTEAPDALSHDQREEDSVVTPLRVLYVDDEPALRRLINHMLSRDGHAVTVAEDGREGIALFREQLDKGTPFDVVITDLGMPNMDGREVARQLKALSPRTPLVLLSGWSQFLEVEAESDPLFHAILNKPPTLTTLRQALLGIRTD